MSIIESEKHGGWARGWSSFVHTGRTAKVNGWVRGKATLDTQTGVLTTWMDLETDTIGKGPCGVVVVTLLGAKGVELARIETPKACRGGKPPGKAVRTQVKGAVNVGAEVARKVKKLRVQAHVVGNHGGGVLGILGKVFEKALKFVLLGR